MTNSEAKATQKIVEAHFYDGTVKRFSFKTLDEAFAFQEKLVFVHGIYADRTNEQ